MKKVKLVKKALLPAVIAVCCSLLALTSVSYAWFTLGNTASVESIDVNVQAADGIQISADASSWKSLLPLAELEGVATNQMPTDGIFPMSTAGVVAEGKMQMFKGTVGQDAKSLTTVQQVEGDPEKNFFAFDIYVKLDNAKKFQLNAESKVGVAEKGNSEIAARVAFINLGTAATAAEAQALNGDAEKVVIWEPNATVHDQVITGKEDGIAITNYYGVKKAGTIVDKDATDNAEYLELITPSQFSQDANGTTSANDLFDLGAGYSKIRVYIWLEGQDVDCTNEISGGNFDVVLNFCVPEEE